MDRVGAVVIRPGANAAFPFLICDAILILVKWPNVAMYLLNLMD